MISYLINKLIPADTNNITNDIRSHCGRFSGTLGLGLNLFLVLIKMIAGMMTGALSIIADALNNLTDAISSIVTMIGFYFAGKKADSSHPFGHGRIEYLTGIGVAIVTLFVGVELLSSSVSKIINPEAIEFSWSTVFILLLAILIKLWMYFFNKSLSNRLNSTALMATAKDSLSDAVSTSVVFLGLIVGALFDLSLDGYLGLVVSIFIIYTAINSLTETINPLLGLSPDPTLVQAIQDIVLEHSEILGIHDLVVHDYGPSRQIVTLHAEINASSEIMHAHDVIDMTEKELKEKLNVQATIHMDPIVVDDPIIDETRAIVAEKVKLIDPNITIHDFRMTNGPIYTNLIFDMVVPFECKLSEEEIKQQINQIMKEVDEQFNVVVEIDRPYGY